MPPHTDLSLGAAVMFLLSLPASAAFQIQEQLNPWMPATACWHAMGVLKKPMQGSLLHKEFAQELMKPLK